MTQMPGEPQGLRTGNRLGCIVTTAATVVLFDFLTKALALHSLEPFKPVSIVPGIFNLSLVFNRGAAFGIFPGAAWMFMILALVTIGVIILFAVWNKGISRLLKMGLGLICGGAAGNLLDRVRFGYVVDFLDFYWQRWHWPAFNIADSSLCIGAGLLLWHTCFKNSEA